MIMSSESKDGQGDRCSSSLRDAHPKKGVIDLESAARRFATRPTLQARGGYFFQKPDIRFTGR
jgi:hypothetical protein